MDMVRDRVRDRDIGRVKDRVRLRGLAIAAPSYSGWGEFWTSPHSLCFFTELL